MRWKARMGEGRVKSYCGDEAGIWKRYVDSCADSLVVHGEE
jgi:hypothetical protein